MPDPTPDTAAQPGWPITSEDDPERVYCANPICGGVDVHPHYHRRPEWGYMPKSGLMTMGDGTECPGAPYVADPYRRMEPSVSYTSTSEELAALRTDAAAANEKAKEQAEGLHRKYHVERLDDEAGKHDACRYFVLDPQHDPLAREALGAYANAAAAAGYGALAVDLNRWLSELA